MKTLSHHYFSPLQLVYGSVTCYLLCCFIGLLIIKDNATLLLIAISIPLGLILFIKPGVSLYVILVSIFFADWLRDLALIPDQLTLLPDVVILFLTVKVIILKITSRQSLKTPVDVPILLYILLGLLSTFLNAQHIITTIVSYRFDLKYVLLFYLLVHLNFDEVTFKRVIFFFMVLLLVQVPVALVKYTIYGQGEEAIGTYAYHTGMLSTILPLVAISIFMGLYFFEKPRFYYIVGSLLFFLFAIIGGKRGFVFFVAGLSVYLISQVGKRNMIQSYIIIPFLIVGSLACIYFVPSLNPTFSNPQHIIDFPISYSTMHSADTDDAAGRSAAIKRTNEILVKKPKAFLTGFGPGSISESFFKKYEGRLVNSIPIIYGRSQWVTMSLENGYLGTLLFLFALLPFFRIAHKVFLALTDPFWKGIAFGFKGICFTYLIGFFYAVVFRLDVSAFIFWFFAANIYCLGKQKNVL